MKEELELDTIDGAVVNDDYYNYANKTTCNGEEFWIIYDKDGLKDYLGIDSYDDFESYLDDIFEYNWGYEDDYQECYNCGKAVYLNDYLNQDYWIDYEGSGLFCSDCINNVPEVRDAYLDYLTNNTDVCNTILRDSKLEDCGLIKLDGEYEDGYFGRHDSPASIFNDLSERYPNGKFIFNYKRGGGFSTTYDVWAFPGYDEGVNEDEKEQ